MLRTRSATNSGVGNIRSFFARNTKVTKPDDLTKSGAGNIRGFFVRDTKVAKPEDLKRDLEKALLLLRLKNVGELEERFLSTDTFLEPWSIFRDSVLLHSPDALPHSTAVTCFTNPEAGISRLDILWFYTQFNRGRLRYDPRADYHSPAYTLDRSAHGLIDKSAWRLVEYEKHLYVWLLQEFKVGKSYSPWRFEYFEFKNICTAWEEVFVPIINAVRASYDVKGRTHYGRLALYVEGKCPSRLAFPDSNIGGFVSSTPYRVVSRPKSTLKDDGAPVPVPQEKSHGMLAKKHYDETEKELRNVYPQYGGLVERPKFKHKMEEWLAEQRARANNRKVTEKHGEVQEFKPTVVKREGSSSPGKKTVGTPQGSVYGKKRASQSPIKKAAESILSSFSSRGSPTKEQLKSPLHGVTRQLHFPDRTSSLLDESVRNSLLPRPEVQIRPSGQKVYSSIHDSNPFVEELPAELMAQRARADTDHSIFSPMGQLSAIPKPLGAEHNGPGDIDVLDRLPDVRRKKSYYDVRTPSYEGTAYQTEISLTDLHNNRMTDARTPEAKRGMKLSRLPTPIAPVAYAGPLRVAAAPLTMPKPVAPASTSVAALPKAIVPPKTLASPPRAIYSAPKFVAKAEPRAATPQPVAWPGDSPTKPSFSGDSGSDSDDSALVLPSKPPVYKGALHVAKSRAELLRKQDGVHDLSRIVSRENIRAALGGNSRGSSTEELAPPLPIAEPVRSLSSQKSLQTFNTHLFPRRDERKGTPAGGWLAADRRRFESGGSYEMDVFRREGEDGGIK